MKPIHICGVYQNFPFSPDIFPSALTVPFFFWYNCAKGFMFFYILSFISAISRRREAAGP